MDRTLHSVEKEEVMAYIDGELPVERAAVVAAHLKQCTDCQALAADLRLASQRMAAWQIEPSAPRLTERIKKAFEQHRQRAVVTHEEKQPGRDPKPRRQLVRNWVWGVAAIAAVLTLLVAIGTPNLMRSRLAVKNATGLSGGGSSGLYIPSPPAQSYGTSVDKAGRGEERSETVSAGPMVVRTAALSLVTKQFDAARAAVERIVREHRGYIAQLTVSGQPGSARALTATLRVPSDQLDAALAELKRLGRVTQESQNGEEVTEQYVDLVARLSNARSTEQRLIGVLRERTGKVADILAVEQEIARVRGEIERMTAERKNLENRVSFATTQLQVSEEYKAELDPTPPSTGTLLHNAMVDGYRSLVRSILDLTLALLQYGPTVLLWSASLFWPARLLWRRLRALRQR